MCQNPSGILYHYTDFAALAGILGDSELRLNNVLNMNDASEMNLFMHSLCRDIAETFAAESKQEKAALTWRIFLREQKERFRYSAYAACFSRYRDDAAQWDRYGNEGRGVCIAFDENRLSGMITGSLSLRKVVYQDSIQGHELAVRIHEIIDRAGIIEEDSLPAELRDVLNRAWAASAVYKHPSFASENEVRLILSPFQQGYFGISPQYHISRERIKKYYPLDLGGLCKKAGLSMEDLVTELIIGPGSTQSLPILQDYLCGLGCEALAGHIVYSGCPLRKHSL